MRLPAPIGRLLTAAGALVLVLAAAAPAAPPTAVTILRDGYGVPHLFTTGRDARDRGSYGNGYAQAEDRLFQMDILRRAATGHLAESVGADFLVMDRVARRDGFTLEERQRLFDRLPPRVRHALEAYRDGVNAYIEKVTLDPRLLPFEFVGTPPAPWEVTDSVAIAVLEIEVFGASGGHEVQNAELLLDLLDRFPPAEARGIFDDLHWIDEPAAPTTIAAGNSRAVEPDVPERFAPAQVDLVQRYAASIRAAAAVLREESGVMGGLGGAPVLSPSVHRHASNAIVIAPGLSASGNPILLGGPQTGLNIPSFFWEVGLHGGGYEAEGVMAPAGPGIFIGRGRNFAMSITSGILDNVDTFIEFLDPADPTRYLFRGKSLPFERRIETIGVAGAADVSLEVLRTVHGPVFSIDRAAGVAFSRQAAFRGHETESAAAVANLGFARGLRDFRRLADRVTPSFNLHYADTEGHIAYFHRGLHPLRPEHTDPRLPLDGGGDMEWRGFLRPRQMPTVVDPPQGYITNWNNKPIATWSAGEQREIWGVVDRVQVFIDALEAIRARGGKVTPDDVKDLMRHAATADIFAGRILPFLAAAVAARGEPADAALPSAVSRLRAWVDAGAPLVGVPDASGTIPYPGAAIYTEFRTAAQEATFADELVGAFHPMQFPALNAGNQEDDHGSFGSPDALFLRALFAAGSVGSPPPAGLLTPSRNYFDDVTTHTPKTRDAVLVAALERALATLATRFGTDDQSRWLMPALQESYRDLGAIGPVFGATVMERENRGSFNLVVELGRPPRGEIIVPPGQAGGFTLADVGNEPPHLRDQLRLYEAFAYRRQPFTESELEGPVTEETIPVVRRP